MTGSARIGLAAALLLGGATFAMAQNGPTIGGYSPGAKNSNPYGYYGYDAYYGYYGHCGRPRYALGTPYTQSHTTATGFAAAGGGKVQNPKYASVGRVSSC
jgi:hypothetical protein